MIASYLVIAGPTGSGKSALALALAQELGGEIVSCDSVQVYRGFALGSAKPSVAEQALVPHHLLDVAAWHQDFDAAAYARLATARITEIAARGRVPVVAGGTGLYLRALLGQGFHADLPSDPDLRRQLEALPGPELYRRLATLDPERAASLHPNDRVRLVRSLELVTMLGKPLRAAGLTAEAPADPAACVVILTPERAALHAKIEARARAMLADGLVEEVRGLLASGVDPRCKPMQSIGYKQVAAHLAGALDAGALLPAMVAATRQYAKRQTTWFKAMDAALRLGDPEAATVRQAWEAFSPSSRS